MLWEPPLAAKHSTRGVAFALILPASFHLADVIGDCRGTTESLTLVQSYSKSPLNVYAKVRMSKRNFFSLLAIRYWYLQEYV
jgi:hypothetical protein